MCRPANLTPRDAGSKTAIESNVKATAPPQIVVVGVITRNVRTPGCNRPQGKRIAPADCVADDCRSLTGAMRLFVRHFIADMGFCVLAEFRDQRCSDEPGWCLTYRPMRVEIGPARNPPPAAIFGVAERQGTAVNRNFPAREIFEPRVPGVSQRKAREVCGFLLKIHTDRPGFYIQLPPKPLAWNRKS